MSTAGRRVGTPAEYRLAIIERTIKAREKLGFTQTGMAHKLTEVCGRPISLDTYRKWEEETVLPIDVVLPLCDLAKIHPYEFLAAVPFQKANPAALRKSKSAA